MRRVFALFLVLVLICSVSCTPHEPAPTDPEAATTTTTSSTLSRDETELIEGDAAAVGTGSTTTTTTTTGAVDSPATTTTTGTTATTTTKKQPVVITTTTTTTTRQQETSGQTTTTAAEEKAAGFGDEKAVAEAIVKYINQYRTEEGQATATIVPGMTVIAEERSKQLVTNFAHDKTAERELLAKYQYGEYVDMTVHGLDASYNYYEAGSEAIGRARIGGTVDYIAQNIATGFRESEGHWRYVGKGDNLYIAVGVTYDPSQWCSWYTCIYVSEVNYG